MIVAFTAAVKYSNVWGRFFYINILAVGHDLTLRNEEYFFNFSFIVVDSVDSNHTANCRLMLSGEQVKSITL